MKHLAVLALILALPLLARAEDSGLYYYTGTVKELAALTLAFAQQFEHKPVLLRGASKAETKLFAGASLKLEDGSAEVQLRNQPLQEDLDSLERQPTVNFVQLQTDQGEAYALVTFGDQAGELQLNPASVIRVFQDALLKALDAKFKRRQENP